MYLCEQKPAENPLCGITLMPASCGNPAQLRQFSVERLHASGVQSFRISTPKCLSAPRRKAPGAQRLKSSKPQALNASGAPRLRSSKLRDYKASASQRSKAQRPRSSNFHVRKVPGVQSFRRSMPQGGNASGAQRRPGQLRAGQFPLVQLGSVRFGLALAPTAPLDSA